MKNVKNYILLFILAMFIGGMVMSVEAVQFNSTEDLSYTIPWIMASSIRRIVISPNTNLVYILSSKSNLNGRASNFGVYNSTYNSSINLTNQINNILPTGCCVGIDDGVFVGDSLYMISSPDPPSLIKYNETTNTTSLVSSTLLGLGSTQQYGVIYNPDNGLLYVYGYNLFSSVNLSNNTTIDLLNKLKIGDLDFGEQIVRHISYSSLNGLMYVGGESTFGHTSFAVYNATSNTSINLTNKIIYPTGNGGFSQVAISNLDGENLYFLSQSGLSTLTDTSFMSYNITSNTSINLTQQGITYPYDDYNALELLFINNHKNLYFSQINFSVYNVIQNTTTSLLNTTSTISKNNMTFNRMDFDSKNQLLYLGGSDGKFAVYSTNAKPIAENVSITPLPLNAGTNVKGHANYLDSNNDVAGGNQTIWYINKTRLSEADNSFTLLGGNITDNTNITFSARFNDTYDWSEWVNSSTANVGDSTAPTLNNCTLSSTSITNTAGNTITLNCTATDSRSNVQTMVACLNSTSLNKTLTLSLTPSQTATGTYSIFSSSEALPATESYYSICQVNVTDSSGNKLSNTTNLDFTVTVAPSGGTTIIGGGGGETKTIIQTNGTPLLSFGTPIIQFIVLNTPTKQEKRIRFVNLGNDTFRNGLIKVKGKAELFVKPYVCDLNLNNCKTSSIEINKGQSAFLVLNGTFDRRILDGVDGIVSISEENNRGTTFELELLVSRPPFYKVVINPLVNLSGGKLSDLSALIIGYSGIGLFGFLMFKGTGLI